MPFIYSIPIFSGAWFWCVLAICCLATNLSSFIFRRSDYRLFCFITVQFFFLNVGLKIPVITLLLWVALSYLTYLLARARKLDGRYKKFAFWGFWFALLVICRLGVASAFVHRLHLSPQMQRALVFVGV